MNSYQPSKCGEIAAPVYRIEQNFVDTNGEIVKSVARVVRPKNKGGFVLMYTEKMIDFLAKTPKGSIVRLFLYLASKQGYGVDGVFGFRTTRKHLQQFLNVDAKTIYSALKYLEDNFLVNELKIDGSAEFMVNPDYVTVGSDRKLRDREWSARWQFFWKHLNDVGKLADKK